MPKHKSSKKTCKPTVVSFRITDAQSKKLTDMFKKTRIVGVRSSNQYARKVLTDYASGRLSYKDPADLEVDYNAVEA